MGYMVSETSIGYISTANLKEVLKERGIDVSGKSNKKDLVKAVMDCITQSETFYVSLCQRFKEELSVTPLELETILSCTRTERIRWCKEGRFTVVCKRTFSKYGAGKLEYCCYDRLQVESVTPEVIESWRIEHKLNIADARKRGTAKAVATKKVNRATVNKFNSDLEVLYNQWKSKSEELYVTFKLAYWTSWINKWAKYYQLVSNKVHQYHKAFNIEENHRVTLKDTFYDYKDQSLKLLSNSKYASIFYYQPDEPDKHNIHLCDVHYDQWLMERDGYLPLDMFYYTHQDEIDKCQYCISEVQRDYYSLYFIEIFEPSEEYSFSFHVPYPIGSSYLPNPNKLKRVNHIENEHSIFRFGRAISEEEMVVHRVNKVEKAFLNAMSEYQEFFEKA